MVVMVVAPQQVASRKPVQYAVLHRCRLGTLPITIKKSTSQWIWRHDNEKTLSLTPPAYFPQPRQYGAWSSFALTSGWPTEPCKPVSCRATLPFWSAWLARITRLLPSSSRRLCHALQGYVRSCFPPMKRKLHCSLCHA